MFSIDSSNNNNEITGGISSVVRASEFKSEDPGVQSPGGGDGLAQWLERWTGDP